MRVHDRVRAAMALIALPGLVLSVATCLAQAPPPEQYPHEPSLFLISLHCLSDSLTQVR